MLLLSNPGINLDPRARDRYGIHLVPQRLRVDDDFHDLLAAPDHAQVDTWIAQATGHPRVVATSAVALLEVIQALRDGGEPDVLYLTSSRHFIGSYQSASSIRESLHRPDAFFDVVDSKSTDIGAGLVLRVLAEATREGMAPTELMSLGAAAADRVQTTFTIEDPAWLLKSGRASHLRVFFAKLLRRRPLLDIHDGRIASRGTYSTGKDRIEVLRDHFLRSRVPEGEKIWLGVTHAGAAAEARSAVRAFGEAYDVVFSEVVPLAAASYVALGPGTIAVAVLPLRELPWAPPVPGA